MYTVCISGEQLIAAISTSDTQKAQISSSNQTKDLPALLSAAKQCRSLPRAHELHSKALSTGLFFSNMYVVNNLITMYAKCGSMVDAKSVFDSAPTLDNVSWNALLQGYVDNGQYELVLDLSKRGYDLRTTCRHGRSFPDAVTYLAVISACSALAVREKLKSVPDMERWLAKGKDIHSGAIENKCCNMFVEGALINMYANCSCMMKAREVFDNMSCRTVVAWNSLMRGYLGNGESEVALELFDSMETAGCSPDARSYVVGLSACNILANGDSSSKWFRKGVELHYKALASMCLDIYVECTLVDMYAKCGRMTLARCVFDNMVPNVVSWNALLQGYVENGESELALELFEDMECVPDSKCYMVALSACASLGKERKWSERGREMHLRALRSHCCFTIYLENKLVDMYGKCGDILHAQGVFDTMIETDVVSWNALVVGYVEMGENRMALERIYRMIENCIPLSSITYLAALLACGSILAIQTGKAFHMDILKSCGLKEAFASCIVDFYGKCGRMDIAEHVFEPVFPKPVLLWNSLMCGYSSQAETLRVFECFGNMREQGVMPDGITFICLLTACSHAGLTERGKEYFESMYTVYGVKYTLQHYTCLIDILSRGNYLDDALRVIKSMPFKADFVMWTTILDACKKWNNIAVGREAYECFLRVDGVSPQPYVLMASIYRSAGMREQCASVVKEAQDRQVQLNT